jgi:hypothetical protein
MNGRPPYIGSGYGPGPPPGYPRFTAEQQPHHLGLPPTQVAQQMACQWNAMPPAARQTYTEMPSRRIESQQRKKLKPKATRGGAKVDRPPEPPPEPAPPPPPEPQEEPVQCTTDARREDEASKKWKFEMELCLRMLWRLGSFDGQSYDGYPLLRPPS